MSKGILVMDMPKNCITCPFSSNKDGVIYYCRAINLNVASINERASACPFKECPKKINNTLYGELMFHKEAVAGWNACIDEILGGSE